MAIFDHATQKSLRQLLGFMNLYQHVKNHFIHLFVFKIQSICPVSRVSCPDWPQPFLTMPPKNFDQLLIFKNLYERTKNQLIPPVHSSDTVNFRDPSQDWPHPLLTMPIPKMFNHLLICVNLYQQ